MKNEIELPEGWRKRRRSIEAVQYVYERVDERQVLHQSATVSQAVPGQLWIARTRDNPGFTAMVTWPVLGQFDDPITAMVACMVELSNG